MHTNPQVQQRSILLVRDQIQQSLEQAAEHLDHYYRDAARREDLQHCQTQLQQVAGCLTMLDLPGAASLTKEMLALIEAIGDPVRIKHERCCELLVAATLFLPRYLEYVRSQGHETPVLLLPTINLLRFVRRAGLIPEHAFVPHHIPAVAPPEPSHCLAPDPALTQRVRHLRHLYQAGLLGVIGNRSLLVHLRFMSHAIERLRRLCGEQPFNELWELTQGLLEAVLDGSLTLDTSIKHTFGVVDRQIRALGEQGPARLARPVDADLRAQLLFYLAKANPAGLRVRALQAHYQLDGCVEDDRYLEQERRRLQTPDHTATQAVARQLLDELNEVRARIQALPGNKPAEHGTLRPLALTLDQIALTLELLGLQTAVEQCRQIARQLMVSDGASGDHDIQTLADLLVSIESTLQSYALGVPAETLNQGEQTDFSQAERNTLQAARQAITAIKQHLDQYLDPYAAGFGQPQHMHPVLSLLHEMQGALQLLQLDQLADTLPPLIRYLNSCQHHQHPPAAGELEALADTIAGVEWFLEDYEEHRGQGEAILETTHRCAHSLSTEVANSPTQFH